MPELRKLLASLADITSYRDVQRLEWSLLKTLDELLRPVSLRFLKLDSELQLVAAVSYNAELDAVLDFEPEPQALLDLPLARKAIQHGQPVLRSEETSYLHAFPVASLQGMSFCLLVARCQPLSLADKELISNFFRIYHNFCHLLKDAQTDELTGLLNRKTFDETFQRLGSQSLAGAASDSAQGRRCPLSDKTENYWLAVVDIDHFKKVNDTFGHIYGDEVLILLSRLMKRVFRSEDLLYRFGGEEFVIIARCGAQANAETLFERFRQLVAQQVFPQIGQVTVSLGVVRVEPGQLASSLLDQADQALYFAKDQGRNRLCFYQSLIEQGQIEPAHPLTGSVDLF